MKSFIDFNTELAANPHWVEWMERMARMENKNFMKAIEVAYGNLIADPNAFEKFTIEESRKYVGNILKNQKPEAVKPQLQQVEVKEEKVIKPEDQPLTGEAKQKRIKEFLNAVLSTPPLKPVGKLSHREIISEGQWEPKKPELYPPTTIEEAKIRDKHFRYIQSNYEPRTGQKLDTWMEEKQWNELND